MESEVASLLSRLSDCALSANMSVANKSMLESIIQDISSLETEFNMIETALKAEQDDLQIAKTSIYDKFIHVNNNDVTAPKESTLVPSISLIEFESIPRYLRGRLSIDKVNAFLGVIYKACSEKYSLLARYASSVSSLTILDRQRCQEWRTQQADLIDERDRENQQILHTGGINQEQEWWISESEIRKLGSGEIPISDQRIILTILRHLGRIREQRSTGSLVRIFLL